MLGEFLVYLAVIFLGVLIILFTVIAYYLRKFYKACLKNGETAKDIENKIEKITQTIKNL